MAKFNRLYAFAAAAICAMTISCTSAPQDKAPEADAKTPAAAAAPADKAPEAAAPASEEEAAVRAAAIAFVKASSEGDTAIIKYIDPAAKDMMVEQGLAGQKISDEDKAKLRAQADDPNSEFSKKFAASMKDNAGTAEALKVLETAPVKVDGNSAYIGAEGDQLHLIKDAEGWKIAADSLGGESAPAEGAPAEAAPAPAK